MQNGKWRERTGWALVAMVGGAVSMLPGCAGETVDELGAGAATSGAAGNAGSLGSAGTVAEPVACEGVVRHLEPPAPGGTGTLRLQLVAEAASGARYRLKDASFALFALPSLDRVEYPNLLSSESAPLADALDVELPSGEYTISLLDGWSLERVDGAAPARATAGLLSPAYGSFRLEPNTEARVRFRFEVSTPNAELAPAAMAPSLDVLERPGPLSGRVCIESSTAPQPYAVFEQSGVDALEGCSELRGELYLGGSLDLRPLAQLRRVCGSLTISSAASFDEPLATQSLEGLEALEEIDALTLIHPGVVSLQPLGALRRIQRPDPATDVLGLFVLQADLADLQGLENVTEIRNIRLDGSERLVSSRGLALPAEMQRVELRGDNLADLVALENLTRVSGDLSIWSAAQDLSALSNLRHAGSLSVWENAQLQNVDALGGLVTVGELGFSGNPLLTALPEFSSLTTLNDFYVAQTSFGGSIRMPALTSAGRVSVTGNPALTDVSLPALTSVDVLTITDNASLASVDLASLSQASAVAVFGNRRLSDAALGLDALGAASLKVGNNSEPTPPLDPCPWVMDGGCDESGGAFGSALCAPGTDAIDCNLTF